MTTPLVQLDTILSTVVKSHPSALRLSAEKIPFLANDRTGCGPPGPRMGMGGNEIEGRFRWLSLSVVVSARRAVHRSCRYHHPSLLSISSAPFYLVEFSNLQSGWANLNIMSVGTSGRIRT